LIENSGPPENVLIVHVYDIYYRDLNPQALVQSPVSIWRWWSFGVAPMMSASEYLDVVLQRGFPAYYRNDAIKDYFNAVFVDKTAAFVWTWHIHALNGFEKRFTANPAAVENNVREHLNWLAENEFEVSSINREAVARLSTLCEEYGFNIYVANAPVAEGLYQESLFQDYFQGVRSFLKEWDHSSACVHYLDNQSVFSADLLESVDHLTYDGAELYTQDLVKDLRNLFGENAQ